jgi:hypothetical protein
MIASLRAGTFLLPEDNQASAKNKKIKKSYKVGFLQ